MVLQHYCWNGQTAWTKTILMDILGFRSHLLQHHLLGPEWELIPVYHSLTIINRNDPAAIRDLIQLLPQWHESLPIEHKPETQYWEIPVCYESLPGSGSFGGI